MSGPIDLHAHSSVSDGTESPAELVAAGVEAGLGVLAITDDDATAGWDQAFVAAHGTGVEIMLGIELSTQLDYASVHILGYPIDSRDPALDEAAAAIRAEPLPRAEATAARTARHS